MSADTVIQWAHDTVNFWWGCTRVSRGCKHCYAAAMAARLSRGRATWGAAGQRWLRVGEACQALLALERRAQRRGESRRVFVNSMSDTFEDHPAVAAARDVLLLIPACVPQLNLLLLTKRLENVARMVPREWMAGKWPRNVWIGTTVEDQAAADARLPVLCTLPAPIRFLSCEPLVGPVNLGLLRSPAGGRGYFDWVIAGGESGQQAEPCDLDWLRHLRDQCARAGTPFFAKQLGRRPVESRWEASGGSMRLVSTHPLTLLDGHGGDMAEWPEDLRVRQLPEFPR